MQGKGYRSLWTAALIFASCWGDLVKAADLGGNCCADLEERVADLEATTAEKGNRNTLYGRVNRIVNFWHDGAETNTYTLNSSRAGAGFAVMPRSGARGPRDGRQRQPLEIRRSVQ